MIALLILGLGPRPTAHASKDDLWAPPPIARLVETLRDDNLFDATPVARLHAAAEALAAVVDRLEVIATPTGARLVDARTREVLGQVDVSAPGTLGRALLRLEGLTGRIAGDLPDDLLRRVLLQGVAQATDPWAQVLDPGHQQRWQRALVGQTGRLAIALTATEDGWQIARIDDPTLRQVGLSVGDHVAAVDGRTLAAGQNPETHLGGPIAYPSVLEILPQDGGSPRRVIAPRTPHSTPSASLSSPHPALGWLTIHHLHLGTPDELASLWTARHVEQGPPDALVVDLRGAPGGHLQAAAEVARWLLGPVSLGEVRGADGQRLSASTPWGPPDPEAAPLVPIAAVLVDGQTASSAEWLAAVIQRTQPAPLLGLPTRGKGVVQQEARLDDRHILRHSVGRLVDPSGVDWIPEVGLTPDRLGVLSTAQPVPLAPSFDPTQGPLTRWREEADLAAWLLAGAERDAPIPPSPRAVAASPLQIRSLPDPPHRLEFRGGDPTIERLWAKLPGDPPTHWWWTTLPPRDGPATTLAIPGGASPLGRRLPLHLWGARKDHPAHSLGIHRAEHPGPAVEIPPFTLRAEGRLLSLEGEPSHPTWVLDIVERGPYGTIYAHSTWEQGTSGAVLPLVRADRAGLDLQLTSEDRSIRLTLPLGGIGPTPQPVLPPRIDAPGASTLPQAGRVRWPVQVEGDRLDHVVLRLDRSTVSWTSAERRVRRDDPLDLSPGPHRVTVRAVTDSGLRLTRHWEIHALPPARPADP